jgi:hypothetical protein
MRTLFLAALALCFVRVGSAQILSVSCTPTTGPTTAGVPYSATCTASGGIAPYSWSISSGALPDGLTLAPSSDTTMATISGTPDVSGSYSYTVQVTDSTPVIPMTATQDYSGTVAPNITSISPTTVTAGQPGFTLTVNGAGFGSDSVVSFNSTALSTTVVNSNQVTASVPMSLTTLAGTDSITLTSGGATSNAATFTVTPTVTSLSPNSATAGGPGFTLTVNGTGFSSGATVNFNGTTLSTTVANPTQLTAAVSASLISSAGSFPVSVTSGGLTSNSVTFTVVPAPSVSSLSPNGAAVGSVAFTLTVNGSNFGGDSVVQFNGNSLTTTVVSASQVTASVPANLLASAGTFPVTVTSGGSTSNSVNFTVSGPTTTSINPATVTAGGTQFLLTVDGTNFVSGSIVQWTEGGATTTLSPNVLSSTELTATVPAHLIGGPGSAQITVKTNSSTSNPQTITVVAGPALSLLDPNTITAGNTNFTLTADGTGFGADAVVNWNGSPLSTSFRSSNEVAANVPANLVASPGTAQVTVSSGGVTSNSLPFTIVSTPTISSIMPDTITAGNGDFTLTVYGSGFASGASVQWNGNRLPTLFVSAGELTASVQASDVAHTGTARVTVSLGGVASNPATFTVVAGPALTSFTPNTTTAGSGAVTLTVTGTGFASGAMVLWNGSMLSTTFHSSIQLTATVPANLTASPATASVTVKSGGVTSNALNFTVVAGPAVTSLNPSSTSVGGGAFTLMVTGTGFVSGDTVQWNTNALATTFHSATQLTATVPANLIATSGTASITVKIGSVTSNALTFTIGGASLTSLAPSSITAGTGAGLSAATGCPANVGAVGTLTINGTGFVSGATAEWNTQPLPTTFVSATQLTACVPGAFVQGYGTAAITVAQGSTTTGPLQISLVLPAVSFTGLQSTSAPTQNLQVGIHLASATPTALQGTLQLGFSTSAPGLPAGYADPGLQFSSGGTTLTFTIPAGATSATAGAIQQGTVEGTITVTLRSLTSNGTNVLPAAVSGTVAIPPLPPVITSGSVQITNLTSSGFDVVLTGYSVTRDMTTANFSFTAAAGTAFSGTSTFSVPVSSDFSSWFSSAQGQANGSMFELTVPFTISGPTSVLGSVSVTLTNSVGTSAPESASP